MEPWSLTIGLVADFADVMRVAQHMDLDQTQLDLIEQMGAALTVAVSENTLNKTYMRGVNEAMNAVQEPDRNWSRWAASMVNAQIPLSGLRRDIRKLQDPLVREAQTIMERLKSAMPYFSDDLPALQDLHGNYVEYEHILNLPLKTFFAEGDEATNEYLRLYETTQNVPVTKPGRRLYGIKLNASEYHDLQQIGRKGIKLNPLTDKILLPNYNPDAEFDNRVRPISAEGFMDFQEVIEYLMSSAQYNDPEVTDYARVVMIKKLQERYDQSARRFLAAHDVEKEGSVAYKVMLKKQNKVRRIHGREKADQMLREQGIEVLEPTGGKSPFKSISNLFSN